MEYLKEMITKDIEKLNNLYHCAIKKIQHYNEETGKSEKPSKNNGYKMELFFNGFIPFLAPEKFAVFEVVREEEFAPVKNAEGSNSDSPNTARGLLSALHAKWIRAAGGKIEGEVGENNNVEIPGAISYEGEGLAKLVEGKEFKAPLLLA